MKQIKRVLIILFTGIVIFSACDTQELKDLNINPKVAVEINPGYLFNYVVSVTGGIRYEAKRVNLFLCSAYIQQFASLSVSEYGAGDKYLFSSVFCSAYFDRAYRNAVKELTMLISNMQDDPEMVNNMSMARIWRTVVFHRITDLYGDVPYSEAGQGYLDQNKLPKYDSQASIYADMLKELDEAIAAFDASKPTWGDADDIYKSDITKWKKFGYSMMLRLGMRMSKVDPTGAASWVQKAIAGGVMTSNDDTAWLFRIEGGSLNIDRNPNSRVWQDEGGRDEKMSKTFIDFLMNTNDPRLDVICAIGDSNTVHYGMPHGYDYSSIKDYEGTGTDDVELEIYSDVNPLLVVYSAPLMFLTYAEVEFMLAEAAERSWGGATDAQSHYEDGVRAAMHLYSIYDLSLDIDDADIDTYLTANPYTPATGLEQIGEQYWVANWMNFYEAYANWRRTGYPVLTPVDYPGNESSGQIPRRIRYSEGEYSVNPANVAAAIAAMGPDAFTTRVWWDTE